MIIKKFVPCIYLYHEHAVRNLTDTTIVDTDPVRLADYYCEHNADELIVFDMSEGDAEHEAALDIIKEICAKAEVDVIGAGNVKRMEDIKKLLYAGCKKAVLDYEKESNIEITEEVSLKFVYLCHDPDESSPDPGDAEYSVPSLFCADQSGSIKQAVRDLRI